jgi:thiamine kinase-like enzyme
LDNCFKESQFFWQQQIIISGDANPRNWATRIDGTLVAFDWQKIGLGPAAIDLATYMCSDESFDMAKNLATMYCKDITEKHPLFGIKAHDLGKQIMLCCVWNYVQFLNEYMQHQRVVSEKIIEHISQFFPLWLKNTASDLKTN